MFSLSPMTLLDAMIEAARIAGDEVLRIRGAGYVVHSKADHSPVTAADQAAETLILAHLARAAPGVAVVAEEAAAAGAAPEVAGRFFLVDPLDGTKEFVAGRDEFTVNIALIEDGVPMLGVVGAPALGRMFAGDVARREAFELRGRGRSGQPDRLMIAVRARPPGGPVAVASRSHGSAQTEAWLAAAGIAARVSIGSSLKFCLVAAGEADVYPRFGPTMEWDTAAGHAVVLAAGGVVHDTAGRPLRYGKPGFRNPSFIVAASVAS
jgi:3'(2'), 5'-bisphosphate nucleotidase